MPEVNACWCGAAGRESFSSHYDRCRGCGTLVSSHAFDPEDYMSADGEKVFYGSHYWQEYVPEVLELPDLSERARSDLGDRAVYYLERVLRYVEPGSKVLELGCAPGSLAFLMDQAGFDVTGVELGAEIVEFVRRRFGIDVLFGPVERAALRDRFDAVIMIDVLEHLPRPKATLEAPAEHLYLHTEESAVELLGAAGFHVVELGTSLFPYDMWMVASLAADLERRADPLDGIRPMARAALDLYDRARVAGEQIDELRADQCSKESLIADLSRQIDELRADQSSKESLIADLSRQIDELRADQSSKESLIADLSRQIEELRADQSAKESLIREISDDLAAVRADQNAKAELIDRLSRELDDARATEKHGAAP